MIGHKRADLLERAISSFVRHSKDGQWELILVLNGASIAVREFADRLQRSANFPLTLVPIPEKRPGAARNFGVKEARGSVLLFLDDDIECFQDIASAAIELFKNPLLQAAGGANLTPPQSKALGRATGGVMRTYLGAASMRQRYRKGKERKADEHGLILCNLAVRKSVFVTENGFATHLISNEENVLLQRLAAQGALLWSSPRLAVFHHRRETWRGLCAQAVKYGGGRAQNILLLPETFRFLYLLPALLLLCVPLLPLSYLWLGWVATIPLLIYTACVILFSAALALRDLDSAHVLCLFVFPAVHFSYAIGFLRVLLWPLRQMKHREVEVGG